MPNRFNREQFDRIVSYLPHHETTDDDYIFSVYGLANDAIDELAESKIIAQAFTVNPMEVLYYTLGEFAYSVLHRSREEIETFKKDENIRDSMASVVADKYISLSMFNHAERKIANRFLPPMSSLDIYLNFMMNILQSYDRNDPKITIVTDLLIKSVSISRCILNLLMDGQETEAFASWRTLHECECTLILLGKHGESLIDVYLKHMRYGIVFKAADTENEEGNRVFYAMKEEMKQHDLKSKDIKKYIEYGWLYSVPGVNEDPSFKLNFRDGLEKAAGLSAYSKTYELSSEIIHSTPMLIYSNKEYYYFLTLLSLYESFFRIEKIFTSIFSKRVNEMQMNRYLEMRKVYYAQLINIHKRESESFRHWQEAQKRKRSKTE